jgi:hypothetical protein
MVLYNLQAEGKIAENKAGKHDAKATYHNKQAEIHREYEQKKQQNAAEKDQKKNALYQAKADKHAGTGAAGLAGANQTADPYNPLQTGPTDQTVNDQFTSSTPIDAQNTSSAAAREGDEIDSRQTASDIPQDVNNVPLHGSGVPVHSSLHSDQGNDAFDKSTTHTMGATPNTGSYV